ncbi:hypothetical protein PoB_007421700 [Plakobranchus ocellatus]|uniref:Uncharacterized protein n=1 Tax=Plakobranchus ocellatus TaxID=259542 RepID=A0AAV4DTN1_9GAST|nr:hypothetical protein PoB_007421700 [Plakobranchus ocellatus]
MLKNREKCEGSATENRKLRFRLVDARTRDQVSATLASCDEDIEIEDSRDEISATLSRCNESLVIASSYRRYCSHIPSNSRPGVRESHSKPETEVTGVGRDLYLSNSLASRDRQSECDSDEFEAGINGIRSDLPRVRSKLGVTDSDSGVSLTYSGPTRFDSEIHSGNVSFSGFDESSNRGEESLDDIDRGVSLQKVYQITSFASSNTRGRGLTRFHSIETDTHRYRHGRPYYRYGRTDYGSSNRVLARAWTIETDSHVYSEPRDHCFPDDKVVGSVLARADTFETIAHVHNHVQELNHQGEIDTHLSSDIDNADENSSTTHACLHSSEPGRSNVSLASSELSPSRIGGVHLDPNENVYEETDGQAFHGKVGLTPDPTIATSSSAKPGSESVGCHVIGTTPGLTEQGLTINRCTSVRFDQTADTFSHSGQTDSTSDTYQPIDERYSPRLSEETSIHTYPRTNRGDNHTNHNNTYPRLDNGSDHTYSHSGEDYTDTSHTHSHPQAYEENSHSDTYSHIKEGDKHIGIYSHCFEECSSTNPDSYHSKGHTSITTYPQSDKEHTHTETYSQIDKADNTLTESPHLRTYTPPSPTHPGTGCSGHPFNKPKELKRGGRSLTRAEAVHEDNDLHMQGQDVFRSSFAPISRETAPLTRAVTSPFADPRDTHDSESSRDRNFRRTRTLQTEVDLSDHDGPVNQSFRDIGDSFERDSYIKNREIQSDSRSYNREYDISNSSGSNTSKGSEEATGYRDSRHYNLHRNQSHSIESHDSYLSEKSDTGRYSCERDTANYSGNSRSKSCDRREPRSIARRGDSGHHFSGRGTPVAFGADGGQSNAFEQQKHPKTYPQSPGRHFSAGHSSDQEPSRHKFSQKELERHFDRRDHIRDTTPQSRSHHSLADHSHEQSLTQDKTFKREVKNQSSRFDDPNNTLSQSPKRHFPSDHHTGQGLIHHNSPERGSDYQHNRLDPLRDSHSRRNERRFSTDRSIGQRIAQGQITEREFDQYPDSPDRTRDRQFQRSGHDLSTDHLYGQRVAQDKPTQREDVRYSDKTDHRKALVSAPARGTRSGRDSHMRELRHSSDTARSSGFDPQDTLATVRGTDPSSASVDESVTDRHRSHWTMKPEGRPVRNLKTEAQVHHNSVPSTSEMDCPDELYGRYPNDTFYREGAVADLVGQLPTKSEVRGSNPSPG